MAQRHSYLIIRFFSIFLVGALVLGGCKGKKKSSSRRSGQIENYDPTRSRSSQLKTQRKAVKTAKTDKKSNSRVVKPGDVAEEVINNAKRYTGTPYKWGGTSRAGMDCSGLLFTSCREAEVSVPRVSGDQANFGKKVDMNELQPGDWVFFSDRKGSKKIVHAGMVTEVKGVNHIKFIHSSTKLGVVESDFNASYYKDIFVKAVRPF